MEMVKAESTKNLIIKAWRLCTTLHKQTSSKGCTAPSSRSCSTSNGKRKKNKADEVTPVGCFSVYVGPEKQRFVVKVEFANHPLFKVLLEDAALEYGYKNDGPLLLPCDVDLFYNVLAEMESMDNINEEIISSNRSLIQIFFSPNSSHASFKFKNGQGFWWWL
ncbi:putative small auxin-up RNA [Rosa chinensis]|uniref:Putative small auxin-up RNA n=1 Tax=Rosa chinensis TaxID=74649 RepID=A0A2P6P4S6_ROSCH|nr:indole-3-acetic acid-induced protein ARG7 [Rosa chinensis]PRQ16923.1 putative small auxin-up RNA [Rosa chinensis]